MAGMDRWPVLQEQPGVKVCECWHHPVGDSVLVLESLCCDFLLT